MDRLEDVEPNLETGKVYVACTNNTDRGSRPGKPGPDAPNPRAPNKNGHIIELTEHRNRADATTFTWNIFMLCGDTTDANTYFAGWTGRWRRSPDRTPASAVLRRLASVGKWTRHSGLKMRRTGVAPRSISASRTRSSVRSGSS